MLLLIPVAVGAQQSCPAVASPGDLPLKYVARPTVAAITPCDLMSRLYVFSDDSMMGREVGTPGHVRSTAYIEREVRRLGLRPAGDSGSYFQALPVFARSFDTSSTIMVADRAFHGGRDFLAQTTGKVQQLSDAGSVFAGPIFDTTNVLPLDRTSGKLVIFLPPAPGVDADAMEATAGFNRWYRMYQSAAARAIIVGNTMPPALTVSVMTPDMAFANSVAPIDLYTTVALAESILGTSLGSATVGAAGEPVTTDLQFTDTPRPGRNVVAIVRGSDPALAGEYIVLGAHSDHLGVSDPAVDHDSLRAYNRLARPEGADGGASKDLTTGEWRQVRGEIDSLHKLHGGARADSINNGADDDGSGTVSLLELAQAFAQGAVKPRRSLLFIWHAGEEKGLWGSEYFTDHPTVPRDSIVAELNLDMVGRGRPSDMTGTTKAGAPLFGAANYLQVIGSRRLSTELGDIVEQVNRDEHLGFTFDYALDADGHPENIYCRSDHAEYARYGIPIAFFTTGGHEDYHQVTDEAQYIDYRHMALVDTLLFDIADRLADLDHRVVVDHAKPDPHAACQQ